MRIAGGALAITLGFIGLWVVTQGYTRNLNAAWNALRLGGTGTPPPTPFGLPAGTDVQAPGTTVTIPFGALAGATGSAPTLPAPGGHY